MSSNRLNTKNGKFWLNHCYFVISDEPPIHPPGTEPVHIPPPSSQPERTVIAPKRPYDNGQDRHYGGPPSKKPFDYNRIGGIVFSKSVKLNLTWFLQTKVKYLIYYNKFETCNVA